MGLFLGASMFTALEFCTLLVALISRLVYSTIEVNEDPAPLPVIQNNGRRVPMKYNKRRNSFVAPPRAPNIKSESNM